jgi:hypothetical protein
MRRFLTGVAVSPITSLGTVPMNRTLERGFPPQSCEAYSRRGTRRDLQKRLQEDTINHGKWHIKNISAPGLGIPHGFNDGITTWTPKVLFNHFMTQDLERRAA